MLNTLVLSPVANRKMKKAPMDMAIKGFHLRGWPQNISALNVAGTRNDAWALSPTFTLKVDHANRLDNLPCAPFAFPFYFDMPMIVRQNAELELEYITQGDPTGALFVGADTKQTAVDADPPVLVLEWEPLSQTKRAGNTIMKHFRVDNLTTQFQFELYRKYHTSILSSFCYEDNLVADAPGATSRFDSLVNFPVMASTNSFVLKYQINPTQDVRLVDEGQLEWWRYGHFRRFYTDAGGSMLPQVFRRRYWPGILLKPDHEFFMDRQLPAAMLTVGTNFVFEYFYMDPKEFAEISKKSGTFPRL